MRSLVALSLVAALAAPAFADPPPADGPPPTFTDEPAQTDAPAKAAPAPVAAPAAAPAPAPSTPAMDPGDEVIPNPPKIWALSFGGAAVGCLLIGGILGGVALSRAGEQEGNVHSPSFYNQALKDNADQGGTLATTSYVVFALGAALAITDVVLWFETYRTPRRIHRSMAATTFSPAGVQF